MQTNQKILNKDSLFKITTIAKMEFNYWIEDNKMSMKKNA